ncbi:EFCB7 protein, partial [Formicarius rufipectus]|nr:EFCB7 protein [Formicarius rufipectus]
SQEWPCVKSKGCFYLEEDGEIISHKYKLHLPQRSSVCITIRPLNVPQVEGESCHWLAVDTALFILKENETQENLQLVSFTEPQDQEMSGWKGELESGVYWLLPFTTGCRLKKGNPQTPGEAKLLCRDEDGELVLTKEFRAQGCKTAPSLKSCYHEWDFGFGKIKGVGRENRFLTAPFYLFPTENFEMKRNELTRKGFLDLILMEATDRDGDPGDLWVTLLSLGYNKALEMTE